MVTGLGKLGRKGQLIATARSSQTCGGNPWKSGCTLGDTRKYSAVWLPCQNGEQFQEQKTFIHLPRIKPWDTCRLRAQPCPVLGLRRRVRSATHAGGLWLPILGKDVTSVIQALSVRRAAVPGHQCLGCDNQAGPLARTRPDLTQPTLPPPGAPSPDSHRQPSTAGCWAPLQAWGRGRDSRQDPCPPQGRGQTKPKTNK